MKAFVTGASGFVGRHLVAHLRDCGDEVVPTDRSDGGPDLLDADGFATLVAEVRPDVVYHLAGQADVAASWLSPIETMRVNVEGTHNILEVARTFGVAKVLTVSSADSSGVVAPAELPIVESAPLRPVSPYAASKAAADLVALQAHLGHGQDVVRARAFNHLGPGQSKSFVGAGFAARIVAAERSGDDELQTGDLTPRRDFTDVRDVVRAYRLLATEGRPGVAYNICSGTSVSIGELAGLLLGLTDARMRLVEDPDLLRPVELPELRGDASLLRRHTGWAPSISLDETLSDVLEDWRLRLTEAQ
ncbi:MAG: GDP-mannose 4,6-dehydratase [Actinomycetota bacterium]|nr:GDP-mannose 4,6-dehydratase [Actinomycetota bacterium]